MNRPLPQPTILYTEDTQPLYERMIPSMQILLNAKVAHTPNNREAENWFRSGRRFDVYVFDDSAGSGGGHGTALTLDIAKTLEVEGRGGIVIAVSSSNGEIVRGRSTFPFTLEDLHSNRIEFWYKHTEAFTMLPWLATCIKEGQHITRKDWLESLGEQSTYATFGDGNDLERRLRLFAYDRIPPTWQGAYYRVDIPTFVKRINQGKYADEALRELLKKRGGNLEKRS